VKKNIPLLILAAVFTAMSGCTVTKGPAGPEGANYLTAFFQDSLYPDTMYSDTDSVGISSGEPNVGDLDDYCWTGMYENSAERMLLYFDISGYFPVNATIKKAYIVLYCDELDGGLSPTLAIYRVTAGWDGLEATWNSRLTGQAWTAPGSDFVSTAVSNSVTLTETGKYYTWELDASMVQKWLDGSLDNDGLVLKAVNESVEEDALIATNTNSNTAFRPRLVINYSLN